MDLQAFFAKGALIVKTYPLPTLFAVIGLLFLLFGFFSLSTPESTPVVFERSSASESAKPQSKQIMVDVEGAVAKPGVYKVSLDARIQDALVAAGGLSLDADREWVAKKINLAAKLADGAKMYIPKQNDQSLGVSANTVAQETTQAALGTETSLININQASQDALDSLPGIGPVTAQKIIDARPFSSIDDLLTKKIVTNKVFEKIKDKITLY